jgi:hypothetical protein
MDRTKILGLYRLFMVDGTRLEFQPHLDCAVYGKSAVEFVTFIKV